MLTITNCKGNFYFSSGLDAAADKQNDDNPGEQKTKAEMPSNAAEVFNVDTRFLAEQRPPEAKA